MPWSKTQDHYVFNTYICIWVWQNKPINQWVTTRWAIKLCSSLTRSVINLISIASSHGIMDSWALSICWWKWFQKWWLLFSTVSIDNLWGVTETFLIITQSSGGLKRAEQQGLWLRENHLAFLYLYIPLKMWIEWVLSFSEPWGVRLFIFNDKHSMLMSPQCHGYWLPTHLVAEYWLFEKHAFPLPRTIKTYMCILPKTECSIHKSRSRAI